MKMLAPLTAAAVCITGLALSPFAHAQDEEPAAQSTPTTETAAASADGGQVPLETEVQRISYALGYVIGTEYGRNGVELDATIFAKALEAGLSGGKAQMSQEDLQMTLMAFQRQLQVRQMQQLEEQAEKGEEFLAQNKLKEGVQTTESGLQYQIIEEGQGDSPTANDTVRVHYRGTLIDGTPFDSSYDRGEPAEFPVNGVIPGWTEALQLMKPGATWKLFIPSDLAYGQSGTRGIPPNSVLIFDVELLDIVE